jgi:hypothetical protein
MAKIMDLVNGATICQVVAGLMSGVIIMDGLASVGMLRISHLPA